MSSVTSENIHTELPAVTDWSRTMPASTQQTDYSRLDEMSSRRSDEDATDEQEARSLLSDKSTVPTVEEVNNGSSSAFSVKDILTGCFWIFIWFGAGCTITIFLKSLMSPEIGFQFMSTLTMIHFLCQWLFLRGVFFCTDMFGKYEPAKPEHFRSVISVGIYTGLDIVLTNFAYGYLSLGCQTMLKNLSPLAIYMIACLMGVEKWRVSLLCVVVVICGACALTVSDVHASAIGVIMLLTAVGFAGIRWVTVQALSGHYKSMQQMALTQPWAAVALAPYVFIFEAPKWFSAAPLPFMGYVYALGTVFCSIFLVLSMYQITGYTSATTLGVIGNARGLTLILYGAFIMGEGAGYSVLG